MASKHPCAENSHVYNSSPDTVTNSKPIMSWYLLDIPTGTSNHVPDGRHPEPSPQPPSLHLVLQHCSSSQLRMGTSFFQHPGHSWLPRSLTSQSIRKHFWALRQNTCRCQQLLTSHPSIMWSELPSLLIGLLQQWPQLTYHMAAREILSECSSVHVTMLPWPCTRPPLYSEQNSKVFMRKKKKFLWGNIQPDFPCTFPTSCPWRLVSLWPAPQYLQCPPCYLSQ